MTSLGVEYGCVYTLTGPDGTVAVFNDSTDKDFVGSLSPESSGLDSPDVREDATDATEEDGGHHGAFFYGRRPVVLQGTIIASSASDRNAKVAKLKRASNALRGDATLTWAPVGGPEGGVELKLRRQQPLRVTKGYVKEFQLPLVAADAYVKGTTPHSETFVAGAEKKFPTTGGNTSTGTTAWASPTAIFTSNNGYAHANLEAGNTTQKLHGYTYKFALPETAVISGIKLEVEALATVAARIKDIGVELGTSAGGHGENKASAVPWSDIEGQRAYGGATDLWGTTWTAAQVGEIDSFVSVESSGGTAEAKVDAHAITVYWSDARTLGNAGDAPAPPQIKIYGPGNTFELENATTGEAIVLEGVELAEGEYFEVDFKNHTILKNGETYAYNALVFASSTWWALEPGENEIVVTGGEAEIEWQDTYL